MWEGLFTFVFFASLVFFIIAVIGHFFWLILEAIFRVLTGRPASAAERVAPAPDPAKITRRKLKELVECGWLDEDVYQRVVVALQRAEVFPTNRAARADRTGRPQAESQAAPTKPVAGRFVPPRAPGGGQTPKIAELIPDESVRPEPVTAEPVTAELVEPQPHQASPPQPPGDGLAAEGREVSEPVVPASPRERVERFMHRRDVAAHEVDLEEGKRPDVDLPEGQAWVQRFGSPDSAAHPPLTRLFAAFMEEKNIRWGELVGGLLIVSGSVALVVSFWSAIAQRPLLKFGVLNGVTASLFGLGFYAARRWRLPTTSQGILITSILLVPLNLLAIAAFVSETAEVAPIALAGEVISVALFTAFVYFAARIVTPDWPLAVTIGVLIPAASQLLVRRFVHLETPLGPLYGFSLVTLAAFCGSQVGGLRELMGSDAIDERRGNELLKRLGLAMFAMLVSLGLILAKSERAVETLEWMTPLSILLALPLLLHGSLLGFRPGAVAMGQRLVGSGLCVAAALVLLGAVAVGWPQPVLLTSLCLVGFATLTAIAWWLHIGEAHALAAGFLTVGLLVSTLVLTDRVGWTVEDSASLVTAMVSAFSGRILTGLAVIGGAVAGGMGWRRLWSVGRFYAIVSIVNAVAGLALVCWFGFGRAGDPEHVTEILACYSALALAGAIWRGNWQAAAVGGLLSLGALVQFLMFGDHAWTVAQPIVLALLINALLMISLGGWRAVRGALPDEPLQQSFILWATAASLTAAFLILVQFGALNRPIVSWHGLIISLVWFALAWMQGQSGWFTAAQTALVASLVLMAHQRLSSEAWYAEMRFAWLHPWSIQRAGLVLSVYGLVGMATRFCLQQRGRNELVDLRTGIERKLKALLDGQVIDVDRAALAIALVGALGLSIYAVVPGAAQELTLRATAERVVPAAESFWWEGLPHQPAQGAGSWILVGVLSLAYFGSARTDSSRGWMIGLLVTASTVPLLLAARWESEVAVASAIRWASALMFLLSSSVLWARARLRRGLRSVGWAWRRLPASQRLTPFAFVLASASLPLLLMLIFVTGNAIRWATPSPDEWALLRWTSVVALIGCVALLVALLVNQPLGEQTRRTVRQAAASFCVLAVSPWVAVTLFVVGAALSAHPIVGPDPGAWFVRIGLAASYTIPLALVGATLVGHALSYRSDGIAFAAGLLFNVSATAAYLLTLRVGKLENGHWLRLGQLNSSVASIYGLGWLIGAEWIRTHWRRSMGIAVEPEDQSSSDETLLFGIQRVIAAGFLIAATCWSMLIIFVTPRDAMTIWMAQDGAFGTLLTSISLVALAAYWVASCRAGYTRWVAWVVTVAMDLLLVTGAIFVASRLAGSSVNSWSAYHLLQVALALAGVWVIYVERCRADGMLGRHWDLTLATNGNRTRWIGQFPVLTLALFSVFGGPRDPNAFWWPFAGSLAASGLSTEMGQRRGRHRWWYFATFLACFAATVWWAEIGHRWFDRSASARFDGLVRTNLIVLGILAVFWTVMDRFRSSETERRGPTIQAASTGLVLFVTICLIFGGLMTDITGGRGRSDPWLVWPAVVATVLACLSGLWDPVRRWAVFGCYLASVIVLGTLLDRLNLPRSDMLWGGTLLLSAHGVATSYLWSRRRGMELGLQRMGLPINGAELDLSHRWLIPLNGLVALTVCGLGLTVQLTEQNPGLRLVSSQAVLAQSLALGLLAHGRRVTQIRYASLIVAVIGAVAFGWCWLPPETSWLNRLVVLACALILSAVAFGLGLIKLLRRSNEWTVAAQELVPALVGLGTLTIVGVLISEVAMFVQDGKVAIAGPAILAVAVALAISAAACLVAAIVPGRDPLGLSDAQRTVYVYGCEALLAVLALHLRMTLPEWFSGVFQRYWTLVVVGLAYLGIGLSEFFRRRRHDVLAIPLERTGVLLPLLPVLGLWVGPGEVHLSIVLLLAGGIYAALSIMRRSFGFGILATAFANGGLWYFLDRTAAIEFWIHPQVWLIPPAICILVAAYLNRDRLTAGQMTSIRYLASSIIYASSTSEIFLNGVAEAPWLPFVLAGLSLAGIFAGIALHVRGFLFLGLAFLAISLFTVIWYAAVDLEQTWLWYVTVIIAGIAIIALFAVFERKRQEILHVMEEMKRWQA